MADASTQTDTPTTPQEQGGGGGDAGAGAGATGTGMAGGVRPPASDSDFGASKVADQPVNQLATAYQREREPLGAAPQGFRDDIGAAMKEADGAVQVAERLDGKLQQLRVQVQRGAISSEQAQRQRTLAIREAKDKLAARRKVGQHMAEALPSRIITRAWPEEPPKDADRDLVRDELDHLAEGSDFFAGDLATYVTEALAKGHTTDARLVLSRWGKAYARRRGVTDEQWAALQVEATKALAKVPGGTTSAATAKAMDLVDAAQRASTVGFYYAEAIVERAARR